MHQATRSKHATHSTPQPCCPLPAAPVPPAPLPPPAGADSAHSTKSAPPHRARSSARRRRCRGTGRAGPLCCRCCAAWVQGMCPAACRSAGSRVGGGWRMRRQSRLSSSMAAAGEQWPDVGEHTSWSMSRVGSRADGFHAALPSRECRTTYQPPPQAIGCTMAAPGTGFWLAPEARRLSWLLRLPYRPQSAPAAGREHAHWRSG